MKAGQIVSSMRLELLAAPKAQPGRVAGSVPASSPTDVLFELRKRLEAGAISEREYAARRKAMLSVL
jgi:hypothetical protein